MPSEPSTTPWLLLIEPDTTVAGLIRDAIQKHFGAGCVSICTTAAQAKTQDISQARLVLAGMALPDASGFDLLKHFVQQQPDLPVVLMADKSGSAHTVQAIRSGAADCWIRTADNLDAIPMIVEKTLAIWRTKQDGRRLRAQQSHLLKQLRHKNHQLEETVHKLQAVAATDPLTGLNNRRGFHQALTRCFAQAQRDGRDLACIMIDVDNFKLVNDSLGHQAGDELLQHTATLLEQHCRRSDIAGRFGGDEFVILLPHTDEATATRVARRIRHAFDRSVKATFHRWELVDRIGLSMGMATLVGSCPDQPDQLVTLADQALYGSKQAGKTRLMAYRKHMPRTTANARHPMVKRLVTPVTHRLPTPRQHPGSKQHAADR